MPLSPAEKQARHRAKQRAELAGLKVAAGAGLPLLSRDQRAALGVAARGALAAYVPATEQQREGRALLGQLLTSYGLI